MNSESLRNASELFLLWRKPIVTSDTTEALLGQKPSNGITADGYSGIALMQMQMQMHEEWLSSRLVKSAEDQGLPAQNLQLRY
jgi:hypothetical protein